MEGLPPCQLELRDQMKLGPMELHRRYKETQKILNVRQWNSERV